MANKKKPNSKNPTMGESGRMSANLRPSDFGGCLSGQSNARRSQNHLASNKQNVTHSSIVTNNNGGVILPTTHMPINKHSSLMFNHDPANSSILSAGHSQLNDNSTQM